jgi:hypothetical protein
VGELTPKEKAKNKLLASERMLVENIIAKIDLLHNCPKCCKLPNKGSE